MIYKYRPLNINTEKMIRENNLYFSHPKDFNDPFDTIINFCFGGDINRIYEKIKGKGLKNEIEYVKLLSKDIDFVQILKENPCILNSSICCFSEKNNDTLMWSHYSDSHRGICLEYETIVNEENICLLFDPIDMKINYPVPLLKVNYVEKPLEKINAIFTNDFVEHFKRFLSTKSKEWEYEKEIRCIIQNSKFNNHPNAKIKENVLHGIIFGLNTPENDKIYYKTLAKKYHKSIVFYSAVKISNEYKLNIIMEQ